MRVLLIGPSLFLPWAEYTARAFRRLGHSVRFFPYSDILVDRLSLRKGRRLAAVVPPVAEWLGRWRSRWLQQRDDRLLRLVLESRPELLCVLRGESLSVDLLRALRKNFSGPLVTWWVDDPFRYAISEALPLYDVVFVFDRSYRGRLGDLGASRVEFLPCACDETIYLPRTLNLSEQARYRSEIALVAWFYPRRARVIRELADFDLKIWGRGWKTSQARRSLNGAARRIVPRERFVPDEEASRIYSATSIGLNIHSDQTREAGLNSRTFELLATGAFELTDHVPGMEELLAPGLEVAVYRSPEEARELAGYYLRHPEERSRISQRGRARVLAEHTYVHRIRQILRGTA